ncbi:AAA family ATPase [Deinococcus hopiensis]|uniref:ATP-, maltotriose-and DNA-dependent transcriptional regulator MalT n=1 Tax=Deinococcus hopiensis KR-140 TaxID=695939 RepID=A0A1W1UL79_9DEIO|nr:AAA family ATPase [Deinococcus hopiensis]SMB81846.1 ATP-, maltotriose-and DNA-dependent transcriptional regulator MalT [Deinococcus hopiensis KR-140]
MNEREDWLLNVQVPRALRAELSRPHLLERLTLEDDARLIALLAPSGYGKTTLLGQYARATQQKVAWLTLTPDMADPLALAEALAYSIGRSLPGLALTRFQAACEEPTQSEITARALARDLAAADVNLRLILDQGHHLMPASSRWLETFLQSLPEGHQVLMGSYDGAHLRIARLSAQAQVLILGARDLAFTPEEAQLYLQVRGVTEHAEALSAGLEGWPAGLALTSGNTALYISPSQIIQEALSALPDTLRATLPEAAVLAVWSETRVRDLGIQLPYGWLEQLVQHGLPLTPLGQGLYRPHQLIVGELERELSYQEERASELYGRAGRLEEQSGNLIGALQAYRRGANTTDLLRLLEQLTFNLIQRSEYHVAAQLLRDIDWRELPRPLQGLAALILSRTGQARQAEPILRALRAAQVDTIPEVALALADAAIRQGQLQIAQTHVEAALEKTVSPWTTRLQLMQAHVLTASGQALKALEVTQVALSKAQDRQDPLELASLYQMAAQSALQASRFDDVRHWATEAIRYFHLAGAHQAVLRPAWELAYVYGLTGETALGMAVCEEALRSALDTEAFDALMLSEMQGNLSFWARDFEGARALYAHLRQQALQRQEPYLTLRLTGKLAEVMYRLNRPEEARAFMRAIQDNARQEDFTAFFRGVKAFFEGEAEEARRHFALSLEQDQSVVHQFRAQVLLSEVLARKGELGRAETGAITAGIQRFGSLHLLQLDADLVPTLSAAAADRGWGLGIFSGVPQTTAMLAKAAQDQIPLEVELLGPRLNVLLGKQPVKIPHSKSREILMLLVVRGPSTREEIIDALWDGDADQRNIEYFKVSVRRLRAVLSGLQPLWFNPLPFEQGRYAVAPEFALSTDLQKLKAALKEGEPEGMQAGVAAFDGRGLRELSSEWGEQLASEVRDLVLEAATWLTEQAANQSEQIWAQERLVDLDPLDHELHLQLIRKLKTSKNDSGARFAYKRYARMVENEYGQLPSFKYDQIN